MLGNKVVPNHSSLIGDSRERAETLQANHRDICRFMGPNDPNYVKVSGELTTVYKSLVNLNEQNVHNEGHIQRLNPRLDIQLARHDITDGKLPNMSASEKSALKRLWYSSMNDRNLSVNRPATETCGWLLEQQAYQD